MKPSLWVPEDLQSCPDPVLQSIVDGVHGAGNPWYDYLFGSGDAARATLAQWVRRPSSEVYAGRCVLLKIADACAGGMLAMTGAELTRCRRSDGIALLMKTPAGERRLVEHRLTNARDLFGEAAADEYYLSKVWVHPSERGRGFGARLVEAFLEAGHRAGCHSYRLDVCSSNSGAKRIYEQLGFTTLSRSKSSDGALAYESMVRSSG